MNFFGKIFKISFLFIILVEIFSFFAYLFPVFNKIAFLVILLVVLILSLVKLEYGLYLVLTELFIGSKGYLFYFETNGLAISLRIGLFLVIISVWFLNFIKKRDFIFRQSQFFKWYLLFFIFLVGGVINGYLKGNSFNNIFFDVNGYLYFGLIFVFYEVIIDQKQIYNILEILAAALLATSIKTLFLVFAFTHNFKSLSILYYWVRTTGVGEITQMNDNFSRIFFQSHLFALISIFLFLIILILPRVSNFKDFHEVTELAGRNEKQRIFGLLVLSLAMILISFSRSFWLGGIIGIVSLYYFLLVIYRKSFSEIFKSFIFFLVTFIISLGVVTTIINFPWWRGINEFYIYSGSLIVERATTIKNEVGVDSRWNLLPILLDKIKENPLIGSGFGTTISYYQAKLPTNYSRLNQTYTTYAFEWGYLDIITKIGEIGLAIYLILIAKIAWLGYKFCYKSQIEFKNKLSLGLLLGLLVVLATNAVSPYLNHPLGIGYLMLTSVIFDVLAKE